MKIIKSLIRDIIFYFISFFGIFAKYRKRNKNNVLVLVYHDIIPYKYIQKDNYNYNTTITPKRFEQQIKYLSKHYTPISLDDFINWKYNNMKLPDNPILITFDDGHKNLYKFAASVLEKYGFKGVFFVNTGCLGKTIQNYCESYISKATLKTEGSKLYNLFRKMSFEEQLINSRKLVNKDIVNKEYYRYEYMTVNDCLDLKERGHYIQSHSVNHYILSSLDEKMSFNEIESSKIFIENNIKEKVTAIAYPFGDPKFDYTEREQRIAKKTGYLLGFSGEWWCKDGITRQEDSFSIPRFGDVNRSLQYFKYLISGYRLPL